MNNKNNVAEVIPLKMPLEKIFHYLVPADLTEKTKIGQRVKISFGNQERLGIIINLTSKSDVENLKEIKEIVDIFPLVSPAVIQLINWISEYYLCPKGVIYNHIIPSKLSKKKTISILNGFPEFKNKNIKMNYPESEANSIIVNCEKNEDKNDSDRARTILFQYQNLLTRDRYYQKLIDSTLKKGKQILILVPDQWSYSQFKKKLNKKYGEIAGLFDKKVTQTEKYLRFLKVASGEIKIVLGTRSNIFLPFQKLGLIIVDQENSALYKEERSPRYNAKKVALARGAIENFPIILGSSAPAIESYQQVLVKNYQLKREKDTFQNLSKLPKIEIINMEEEKSFQRIISFKLQQSIIQCLRQKEKIILFINRRGFAGYLICSHCGNVVKCPDCGNLLSYHLENNKDMVLCHECGKKIPMKKKCSHCGRVKIKPLGFGTQHAEVLIKRMFPRAIIRRLDIDVAPKRIMQKKIVNEFNKGEIDILIGTQLIFQEINFEKAGLLALLFADHMLNITDYSSAELSYQFIKKLILFLTQKEKEKSLIIQTYQPDHYIFEAIKNRDYNYFYQEETKIRRELDYPPFTKIIKIDFFGEKEEKVKQEAVCFLEFLEKSALLDKSGLDAAINKDNLAVIKEKEKNKIIFTLKVDLTKNDLATLKRSLLKYNIKNQFSEVRMTIDIDPIKMS